jgi:DNA-directed RNA polymerase specialized sigma24 family protein
MYLGPDIDEAIIEFQQCTDPKRRDILIKDKIWPAFEKLATYHYQNSPIRKNEDVIQDCVIYLYEKMPGYNPEVKKQSFSYFNMIARNFFYQKLNLEKREVSMDQMVDIFDSSVLATEESLISESFDEDFCKEEFFQLLRSELPKWRDKSTKEIDVTVLDALILIFENIDNIDIYKKKAIFFYVKEITDLNSKQIARSLKKISKKFYNLKAKYLRGEI